MEYVHSSEFEVQFDGHLLKGDTLGNWLGRRALMLHGAGQAHRGKMLPLREELFDSQVGSCAFDFIGHGETGGDLRETSLENRTRQARAVIEQLGLSQKPISIVAASMSAHTAVQLTRYYEVDRLVLIVPAMYSTAAYDIQFGPAFTEIIRAHKSWRDSDGWELLREYKGDLLVIAAEMDKVIPDGVVRRYFDSAKNARLCRTYAVPGAGHMVFTELRQSNPVEMAKVRDMIIDVLL